MRVNKMSVKSYRKTMFNLAIKCCKEKKPNACKIVKLSAEDNHECHLPRSKNGGSFKCNYCGKKYSLVYAPHGNYRWKRG